MIRTVGSVLVEAAAVRGSDSYLLFGEESFTFGEVEARAAAIAAGLQNAGIEPGDRVALLARNGPAHVFTWFGVALAGAVLVPMDPNARLAGIGSLLRHADPALLTADEPTMELAGRASREASVSAPVSAEELSTGGGRPKAVDITPDDVVVMLPTSGTTGVSKLAMQTHRSFVLAGEGFAHWVGLRETDRLLTALPLFHLNALAYSVMGALCRGLPLALLPSFSASTFLGDARRHGATVFNAVGALLEILMRQPERPDDADNPLRLCYSAPAPADESRHLEIERRFGFRVTAGYGSSESPYGTTWPLEGPRPYGSMGRLKQHPSLGTINTARVVDEGGRELADNETGELWLRNPAVMKGYFNMPHETAEALRDGWLRTGDVVRRDADDVFHFVARKKDIIRRRGENIAPAEIENALGGHPDVLEAAVVAVPSELGEDEIKAFIVVRDGAAVDETSLRKWMTDVVGRQKVPGRWEFVTDLPRTPTGRVAKHLLDRS
jgi:crotonobetaine/carnitine-CoA ligase